MKFSILWQHYDPEHRVCDMAMKSLHSIVSNSVGHDYEIIPVDRKGLIKDINRAMSQARGEYIIVIANDCFIEDPEWLLKFPIPGTISGWHGSGGEFYEGVVDFSAAFCMPRDVMEKIGPMDERFEGYGYADDDYFYRAKQLGIPFQVVGVKLTHLCSQTFKAYEDKWPNMTGDLIRNRTLFIEKHGINKPAS